MLGLYVVYFKYIAHYNFIVISGSTISPSSVAKLIGECIGSQFQSLEPVPTCLKSNKVDTLNLLP